MERKIFPERLGWKETCEEVGFPYWNLPSKDGTPYWQETAAYQFYQSEIDKIESATEELHAMCMDLVSEIITSGDYHPAFGFPIWVKELIEKSWKKSDMHLYGRFDLAYDGNTIKMLEYNADTPTSLLEASVVQWNWLVAQNIPNANQFNSIHEALIQRWKEISLKMPASTRWYFSAHDDGGAEDWGNLEYLMYTAVESGLNASELPLSNIGWHDSQFVDIHGRNIDVCFKLYPWEHMVNDEFGKYIKTSQTNWLEPIWKMLLSNKVLLPLLWKKYPNHPFLLPAFFEDEAQKLQGKFVKKATLSREGSNISLVENEKNFSLSGSEFNSEYDKSGYIFQQWMDVPVFSGFYPIIGSWVVGDNAVGIGIREDSHQVTGNDAHFVSHFFIED